MTGGHFALIVEDDCRIAEELAEILKSLECESITIDNKRDAIAAIRRKPLCLILLDLEIKLEPASIKGHTEHGSSLLREIRRVHSEHTGLCHWLPVIIVSGFAREALAVLEVMKDGANDVIQKPFTARKASETIRRELERCGRSSHGLCSGQPHRRRPTADEEVLLAIPGDRIRRRTRVLVESTSIMLPNSSLKVLLQLMVARKTREHVHKRDLGAKSDQGFKGISVLREWLKPALGEAVDIIGNDHHGFYCLTDNVVVGDVNAENLLSIGDEKISEFARRLRRALDARGRKADGNS